MQYGKEKKAGVESRPKRGLCRRLFSSSDVLHDAVECFKVSCVEGYQIEWEAETIGSSVCRKDVRELVGFHGPHLPRSFQIYLLRNCRSYRDSTLNVNAFGSV